MYILLKFIKIASLRTSTQNSTSYCYFKICVITSQQKVIYLSLTNLAWLSPISSY